MSKAGNIWENNISAKHKKRVADALGIDVFRIVEMDMKLAGVGRDERIDEAKRKCAEKWAKREERLNITTTK
jgi:hypothetical protein